MRSVGGPPVGLCGGPPFEATMAVDLLLAHSEEQVPPLIP